MALSWKEVAIILTGLLTLGGVTYDSMFTSLDQLTGVEFTYSGDQICGAECESYLNATSSYWRICFDYYNDTKYEDEVLFKKQSRSRTLHINLDNVEKIITTSPDIPVELMVPTYGNKWRLIKGGDCIERGKINKYKLVGHKLPFQTVKWGFNLSDSNTDSGVEIDPAWIGITGKEIDTWKDDLRKKDTFRIKNKEGNYKSYDRSEKKILIEDKDFKPLVNIKLTSSYTTYVSEGESVKVAEFLLVDWKKNVDLFEDISFFDKTHDYKTKQKEYTLKYGTDYEVEECMDMSEFDLEVPFCQNNTKTNWTEFNLVSELPSKNIKIGLFTNTTGEKNIEWVPNIQGFDILEWADYELIGLASYYDIEGEYSVENIYSIAVSPDGNYLFTSSYTDNYVSIMNITNKSEIVGLASYYDSEGEYSVENIYSIAVSPDGNYLFTSSYTDNYVSIMNITNKSEIVGLASYYDIEGDYSIETIMSIAVSPDGNYLFTTSSVDAYVSIINITNKSEIVGLASYYDIEGEYSVEYIMSIAVSPDGNYLFTSSYIDD